MMYDIIKTREGNVVKASIILDGTSFSKSYDIKEGDDEYNKNCDLAIVIACKAVANVEYIRKKYPSDYEQQKWELGDNNFNIIDNSL